MKEILKRKRQELRAWLATLPQYADLGPDTDKIDGQMPRYREVLAQLKLIAELLEDECWHEGVRRLECGFWKCDKCGGYWRNRPDGGDVLCAESKRLTREQVVAEVEAKI